MLNHCFANRLRFDRRTAQLGITLATVVLAIAPATGEESIAPGFTIRLAGISSSEEQAVFLVEGIERQQLRALRDGNLNDDEWKRLLAVYVAGQDKTNRIAVFGSYRVDQDTLVFQPRYSLSAGLTYRVVFDPSQLPHPNARRTEPVQHHFTVPSSESKPTTLVTDVFPSRSILPENQLKFYIHFSAPMSRGEAYRRIRLVESSGRQVVSPFLELGEELWDYSGTRFTLFFHPGRIKRGLVPRKEMGPALEEGKSYRLVIDSQWLDANGQPLQKSFSKSFKVIAPDDVQPDLKKWKLNPPQAKSDKPLVVQLDEPLDHAMLHRVLVVVDSDRRPVAGDITVDREETRWRFRPASKWAAGDYAVVVDTTLEDLAGNSPGQPFEIDVFDKVEKQIVTPTVSLPFVIR